MTEVSIRNTYFGLVEDIVWGSLRNLSTSSRCSKLTYLCRARNYAACTRNDFFRLAHAVTKPERQPTVTQRVVTRSGEVQQTRYRSLRHSRHGWVTTDTPSFWVAPAVGCLGKTPYSKRRWYVQPITGVRRLYRSTLMRCDQEDVSFGKPCAKSIATRNESENQFHVSVISHICTVVLIT